MSATKWIFFIIGLWNLLQTPARAEVSIAVGIIPGLLEKGLTKKTPYMQLMLQLQGVELNYVPLARADKLFTAERVQCVFPGSMLNIPEPERYIESKAVNTIKAYIFYKDKHNSINDLTGKTVGIRRGLNFGDFRSNSKAKLIDVNTDINGLHLLNRDRADAIVAYLSDIEAAQKQSGIRQLPYYDASVPVHEAKDALVCYKNPETIRLIGSANKLITAHQYSSDK